jgi:phosphoribosylformimino-5-aminoimidazole carboxamide ribotide isomerase
VIFEKWIAKYGADKIILGSLMQIMKSNSVSWLEKNLMRIPFIQDYQRQGIQYVICTDIAKKVA